MQILFVVNNLLKSKSLGHRLSCIGQIKRNIMKLHGHF
jgi:hypothetical protein